MEKKGFATARLQSTERNIETSKPVVLKRNRRNEFRSKREVAVDGQLPEDTFKFVKNNYAVYNGYN